MEGVRERRKAKLAKATCTEDEEAQTSKKWTEEESRKLLRCLKLYGHKNLGKMEKELPGRSKEDIRKFLINVHALARQRNSSKSCVKYWLEKSISEMEKSRTEKKNDYYHCAQIMKFLSVDGLVENHPIPKNCGGIDFSAAYRLIYQSLMGYPLQPVNKATADFIIENFPGANKYRKYDFTEDLIDFLKNKYQDKTKVEGTPFKVGASNPGCPQKKLAVYERKRPAKQIVSDVNKPPLKIFLEERADVSNNIKCYALSIGDKKDVSTVVVPVVRSREVTEVEKTASELWKNVEFNPLGLPDKWSKKPLSL